MQPPLLQRADAWDILGITVCILTRAHCCLQPFDKTMEGADKVHVGADASNHAMCSHAELGKAASGRTKGSHTATAIGGMETQQLEPAR